MSGRRKFIWSKWGFSFLRNSRGSSVVVYNFSRSRSRKACTWVFLIVTKLFTRELYCLSICLVNVLTSVLTSSFFGFQQQNAVLFLLTYKIKQKDYRYGQDNDNNSNNGFCSLIKHISYPNSAGDRLWRNTFSLKKWISFSRRPAIRCCSGIKLETAFRSIDILYSTWEANLLSRYQV